MMDEVI